MSLLLVLGPRNPRIRVVGLAGHFPGVVIPLGTLLRPAAVAPVVVVASTPGRLRVVLNRTQAVQFPATFLRGPIPSQQVAGRIRVVSYRALPQQSPVLSTLLRGPAPSQIVAGKVKVVGLRVVPLQTNPPSTILRGPIPSQEVAGRVKVVGGRLLPLAAFPSTVLRGPIPSQEVAGRIRVVGRNHVLSAGLPSTLLRGATPTTVVVVQEVHGQVRVVSLVRNTLPSNQKVRAFYLRPTVTVVVVAADMLLRKGGD